MAAVALTALLILPVLVFGDGRATVEFVNRTTEPIADVAIGHPGGQIRAKDLAPGGAVQGRARASVVRSDRSFDITFRVSVLRAGEKVRTWDPGACFSPYHYEPYVRYELIEGTAGRVALKSEGFAERPTPRYKKYLWDKMNSFGLGH
jgi:hypothetical protein